MCRTNKCQPNKNCMHPWCSEILAHVSEVSLCHITIKCPRKTLKPTLPTFACETSFRYRILYSISFLEIDNHKRISKCRSFHSVGRFCLDFQKFCCRIFFSSFFTANMKYMVFPNTISLTLQNQIGVLQLKPDTNYLNLFSIRLHSPTRQPSLQISVASECLGLQVGYLHFCPTRRGSGSVDI